MAEGRPTNERLRAALVRRNVTVDELAERTGVDAKTCQRWISDGRIPYRRHALAAARALGEDPSYLWPVLEEGVKRGRLQHPELVAVYPTRADAPLQIWRDVLETAHDQIGVLVYAALFLIESWPGYLDLLAAKATAGCRIQILLGDPDSPVIAGRGAEEAYGHGVESRCRVAALHYQRLTGIPGVDVRLHDTTLYNSIYYGDDKMVVNSHVYGMNAFGAPIWRIRRLRAGGLFDTYTASFQAAAATSRPLPPLEPA